MQTLETFDIRNFIDRLTPAKGSNRYECPSCEGNDLTIDPKTGEYQCWHGCECKDIREAIRPWEQVRREAGIEKSDRPYQSRKPKKTKAPAPAPIPDTIELARLPQPVTLPQKRQLSDGTTEIIYRYSDRQWIRRLDWKDPKQPKGRDKRLEYWHLDAKNTPVKNKGEEPWSAYRLKEAIAHGKGNWILDPEGEKCVEAVRWLGLVAINHRSEEDITPTYRQLKAAGVAGIAILPDNDDEGIRRATVKATAATAAELPYVIIPPHDYWSGCPKKGDVADWIEQGRQEMDREDFVRKLNSALGQAAGTRREEIQQDDPDNRLKLEVLAYADTSDPIKKTRLKGQICSHYRISGKDLDTLAAASKHRTTVAATTLYSGKDFLLAESPGVRCLVSGRFPAAGVTIIAGDPGIGKSSLGTDLGAAILYGDEFLGEVPTQTGKVLFVHSDEGSISFAQDRFINRGYAPDDQWRVLTGWEISRKEELERLVEDFRPTLIVVDSLAGIHLASGIDENSTQAGESIRWLDALSGRYNCAIALVHHANKNKEQKGVTKVRGNGDIAAAASMVLVLEGEGDVKNLSSPKTRGIEPFKLKVKLNPDTGRWSVIEGAATDSEEVRGLAQRILRWFANNHPEARLETSEIAEGLGVSQSSNLWKSLDRLVKSGQLVRRPSQSDRRRKVYGLPKNYWTDNEGHSPSPARVSLSSNSSESIAVQGLEGDRKLLDNYSTITRQNDQIESSTQCLENLESLPDIASSEITGQSSRQGGGVSPVESVEGLSSNCRSLIEDLANQLRAATTRDEVEEIKAQHPALVKELGKALTKEERQRLKALKPATEAIAEQSPPAPTPTPADVPPGVDPALASRFPAGCRVRVIASGAEATVLLYSTDGRLLYKEAGGILDGAMPDELERLE